jgi:acetylglutamate synthase
VKLEDLIDDSIVRELDKSGYFERINAEYGVK